MLVPTSQWSDLLRAWRAHKHKVVGDADPAPFDALFDAVAQQASQNQREARRGGWGGTLDDRMALARWLGRAAAWDVVRAGDGGPIALGHAAVFSLLALWSCATGCLLAGQPERSDMLAPVASGPLERYVLDNALVDARVLQVSGIDGPLFWGGCSDETARAEAEIILGSLMGGLLDGLRPEGSAVRAVLVPERGHIEGKLAAVLLWMAAVHEDGWSQKGRAGWGTGAFPARTSRRVAGVIDPQEPEKPTHAIWCPALMHLAVGSDRRDLLATTGVGASGRARMIRRL